VVQASVSRSFYGTKKQVVSFYENLRVVYEVESKMREMRRDTGQAPAQPRPSTPQSAPKPHVSPQGRLETGDSRSDALDLREASSGKRPQQVERETHGSPVPVNYRQPSSPAPRNRVAPRIVPGSACQASVSMPGGATGKERNRV
jgi:hypothetical protein